MHSVLCVSAQHLTNWARKAGDMDQFVTFNDLASRHRSKSLSLLRIGAAGSNVEEDAVAPAALVMLLLAAVSQVAA